MSIGDNDPRGRSAPTIDARRRIHPRFSLSERIRKERLVSFSRNARSFRSRMNKRKGQDEHGDLRPSCGEHNLPDEEAGQFLVAARRHVGRRDHRRSIAASTAPRLTHVKHACVRTCIRACVRARVHECVGARARARTKKAVVPAASGTRSVPLRMHRIRGTHRCGRCCSTIGPSSWSCSARQRLQTAVSGQTAAVLGNVGQAHVKKQAHGRA